MRTVDRPLIRDVAALAAAAAVVGASFGAIAIAGGMPVWLASAMSMLVFAGGAQFMAVGVVAGGGSPVAAVLAGLLLNARHLPFGLAVADVLGPGWGRRLAGSHIMTDEAVAFALAQDDPRPRRDPGPARRGTGASRPARTGGGAGMTLVPILVLAVGTYAFRLAGPLLRKRIEVPDSVQRWLSLAAVALLAALVATAALTSAG